MEPSEPITRSFRYEDYSNRRVFLRSYPLHWDGKDDEKEDRVPEGTNRKRLIKELVLSAANWGEEKVLVLRRLKVKLAVYVIACVTFGFKHKTALISAKSHQHYC